jgi:formylglycine-generating enzyme required for sulfatase activity
VTFRIVILVFAGSCALMQAEIRVNPRDGLKYVLIPAGIYSMGCSPGDHECFDWEMRPHEVTIGKPFWLGETEVTQAAFERVTGTNPSMYKGADRPVDQVGWSDASKYCANVDMRLPTEAEWEYAARGGSNLPKYAEVNSAAWYDGNSQDQTHPVAQKAPNAYGLYDMLGNLWEWVEDSWNNKQKILRGGSFYNLARDLRVSNRLWAPPDTRHRDMGFRCAGD